MLAYFLAPVLGLLVCGHFPKALSYISSCLEILANQGYKPQFIFNSHSPISSTPPLQPSRQPVTIPPASPALTQRQNSNVLNTLCRRIPLLTPSRTKEDAMERALHGSCACGRNRYIVEIPAGSAQLAELTYDNSSAARKSKISSAG